MRVSASACATRSSTTAFQAPVSPSERRQPDQPSLECPRPVPHVAAEHQVRVIGVHPRVLHELVSPMLSEDLRHLLADRQPRIQCLPWILEDHRDVVASDRCASAVPSRSTDPPSPVPCPRTRHTPLPCTRDTERSSAPLPSHAGHPTPPHAAHVDVGRNNASPPANTPGGRGTRRSNARAVTLLPEPVSPTNPSVSPCAM